MRFRTIFHKKYVWSWILLTCFCLIRVVTLIGERVGVSRNRILEKLYHVSPIFYFLSLCLIGPVVEEFIFRYLVFRIFGKKGKRFWLSCFISFFAFIFAHPRVWKSFIRYFPWLAFYALFFIFIYWLSGWNFFFPVLSHILINTIFAIFFICHQ